MTNQKKAYAYALATVLLWSTVASAFKLSLRYLDHIQLLFYSTLVSIITLAAILTFQGKVKLLFSFSREDCLRSLAFGFLNPFLYYLVLFKAYALLPAQEAQPLNYTWAIALALLSIPLLQQKISPGDLAATFICYTGVLVISTHGDILNLRFENPAGVALALISTVIWALYWIFNTKDRRDPVVALFLNFLLGFPFVATCTFFFSSFEVTNAYGLLGAAYVGLFEMGITFVTWLTALKLSENTARVGNLIFISPFVSLILISFLVGERILPSTYIGLALIVAGLGVQQMGGKV